MLASVQQFMDIGLHVCDLHGCKVAATTPSFESSYRAKNEWKCGEMPICFFDQESKKVFPDLSAQFNVTPIGQDHTTGPPPASDSLMRKVGISGSILEDIQKRNG